MPPAYLVLLPPIHVQVFADGLNSQRSLNSTSPLKSHRFPLLSVQLAELERPPGKLAVEPTPSVPYTPVEFPISLPLTQVHILVVGLNSQRSLRSPTQLLPPKSHRLPLLSTQLAEFERVDPRPAGTL